MPRPPAAGPTAASSAATAVQVVDPLIDPVDESLQPFSRDPAHGVAQQQMSQGLGVHSEGLPDLGQAVEQLIGPDHPGLEHGPGQPTLDRAQLLRLLNGQMPCGPARGGVDLDQELQLVPVEERSPPHARGSTVGLSLRNDRHDSRDRW